MLAMLTLLLAGLLVLLKHSKRGVTQCVFVAHKGYKLPTPLQPCTLVHYVPHA